METYKVGQKSVELKFALDITTIGLAASRAVVFDENNANPVSVAFSKDATGDIFRTPIGQMYKPPAGQSADLAGKTLSVLTKIDLSLLIDKKMREEEFNRLTARFFLDDGDEGHKEFNQPDFKIPADDFSVVQVFSTVNLTA